MQHGSRYPDDSALGDVSKQRMTHLKDRSQRIMKNGMWDLPDAASTNASSDRLCQNYHSIAQAGVFKNATYDLEGRVDLSCLFGSLDCSLTLDTVIRKVLSSESEDLLSGDLN